MYLQKYYNFTNIYKNNFTEYYNTTFGIQAVAPGINPLLSTQPTEMRCCIIRINKNAPKLTR